MLLVWAERTDVARRVVHQSMPHHLVFTLKSLASEPTRAAIYRTKVRAVLRVHVGMRTAGVIRLG